MSVQELTTFLNCAMPDGSIIKAIHLYSDKIRLTLINGSTMTTQELTYEQFYGLFGD